jgi:hypothetical protein
MPSQAEIMTAFNLMRNTKMALFHAGERELSAKEEQKRAELEAIGGGLIDGKNELIRKAQLAQATEVTSSALEKSEAEKRECQLAYDLAVLAVDCLKWQIRNELAQAELQSQGVEE